MGWEFTGVLFKIMLKVVIYMFLFGTLLYVIYAVIKQFKTKLGISQLKWDGLKIRKVKLEESTVVENPPKEEPKL